MSQKNRNLLTALLIIAVPVLMFVGFLISEIIKPTTTSLAAPATATNGIQSPR